MGVDRAFADIETALFAEGSVARDQWLVVAEGLPAQQQCMHAGRVSRSRLIITIELRRQVQL
jgi:hypothetical protein